MTFPQVAAITSSSHDSAVTNHTVDIGSPTSGELCIVFFGNNGASDSGTFPGGWTKLNGAGANNIASSWAYRVCTGSEGASITVTTGSGFRSAHQVYRIQGHNSSTTAPQGQTPNSGTDAAPNPPSIVPTGGAKDYLFIVGVLVDSGNLVTVASTDYGDLTTHQSGTQANLSVGCSSFRRAVNAASQDPGTCTISGAEGWLAYTIAVHPGTEGNPAATTRPLHVNVSPRRW